MTVYRFNKSTGQIEVKKDEHPTYVSAFISPPTLRILLPQTYWRNLSGKHRRSSPAAHSGTFNRASSSSGAQSSTFTFTDWAKLSLPAWEPPKPPTAPPPIPYAGIRTGEIIAWRMWWAIHDGLQSIAHKHRWKPGATETGDINAIVFQGISPFTFEYITIFGGVYTFFSREGMKDDLRHHFDQLMKEGNPSIHLIVGRVKLWGEVVEHKFGYRAEFAKIYSIDEVHGLPNAPPPTELLAPYYAALEKDK